jgi:hypothetical protein
MGSLSETNRLRYNDPEMKGRVTAAVGHNAANILNEDPGTPNHEARVTWADSALANSQGYAEQAMWDVVLNPAINEAGDAATDNDILFAVSSWINKVVPIPPPLVR